MSIEEENFNYEAVETIVTLLKSNVQRSDIPNIGTELKQNFVLSKRKSKEQRIKQKKSKKKQCLTRKEKLHLGFYTIPRDGVKYEEMLVLNHIWTGYMEELLDLHKPVPECPSRSWESFTQSVYKADFHGSILKVIRSKCPSYVSKIGICIMDTKNTFKIISKDNVITTIPKKCSVFELYLKNLRIALFGKHMCIRPAERSNKKFKGHSNPDL